MVSSFVVMTVDESTLQDLRLMLLNNASKITGSNKNRQQYSWSKWIRCATDFLVITWFVTYFLLHTHANVSFYTIEEVNVSTISPIGPDELPPPYQQAGMPMVTCRVCQAMIDISGKREQHVVKCSECNEATVCLFIFSTMN